MILCAIAAMADNGVIGKNNKLPWHIPEDLNYFKRITLGKKVIMGRKTFDSMGGKPLPQRENIVVTRNPKWKSPAASIKVYKDLDDALKYCAGFTMPKEEVFIIGGAEIYQIAMPKIQRLYLTLVHTQVDGDTYFPKVDLENTFKVVKREPPQKSSGKGNLAFTILIAERGDRRSL